VDRHIICFFQLELSRKESRRLSEI